MSNSSTTTAFSNGDNQISTARAQSRNEDNASRNGYGNATNGTRGGKDNRVEATEGDLYQQMLERAMRGPSPQQPLQKRENQQQ